MIATIPAMYCILTRKLHVLTYFRASLGKPQLVAALINNKIVVPAVGVSFVT
jgi:hypothetical protein